MREQTIAKRPGLAEDDTQDPSEQSTEEVVELFTELVGQFDEIIQLLEPMRARAEQQEAAPLILWLPEDEESESDDGESVPGVALIIPGGAHLAEDANGAIDQEKFGKLLKKVGQKLKKVNWGKVAGSALKGGLRGIAGGPAGIIAGAATGGLKALGKDALRVMTQGGGTQRPGAAPRPSAGPCQCPVHTAPAPVYTTPPFVPEPTPVNTQPVNTQPTYTTSQSGGQKSLIQASGQLTLSTDQLVSLAQQLAPILAKQLGETSEFAGESGEYSTETYATESVSSAGAGYYHGVEASHEDDQESGVLDFLTEITNARAAMIDAFTMSDKAGRRRR